MNRVVHVLQGFSAAACFRQALQPKPGDLLVHDDVLSCGPLTAFRSPDEWSALRGAYWNSIARDRVSFGSPFNGEFLAAVLALPEGADSVVIWIGTDTADQLLLAFTVHLLGLRGPRPKVDVVQFVQAGKQFMDARALALLHPEQIADHPPVQPLSAEAIADLENCWEAVTSSDPTQWLSRLSEQPPSGVRCWRSSLRSLVQRYPDPITGLGRWDFELLRYVREKGPRATRVIGHTMGNNMDEDMVGDAYLFWRLRRLAAADLAHPLIAVSGDPTDMRKCEVALTEAGETVFAGGANAIELNGIDDQVLGVHLDSKQGAVWYRKDGALVAG